jgi:adenosylcobinamide amidohydrolase
VRLRARPGALEVRFEVEHRCLASAVLGGGLGLVRTWLNLQVPPDYGRTDPEAHLGEASAGLAAPVVGMLTAADVTGYRSARRGDAVAVATVGATHALAAAGRRPRAVPSVGTINLLVVVRAPLTDAALAGALLTAVEAKAQALADARVPAANAPGWATGTATDSVCVACPPGARERFAGPATRVGGELARAVHAAVLAGALAEREREAVSAPSPWVSRERCRSGTQLGTPGGAPRPARAPRLREGPAA